MVLLENESFDGIGKRIHEFMTNLYPICRSITGNGVRDSLKQIKEYLPNLEIHEVPSGSEVFDWKIPNEWNIKDAFVKNSLGEKVIDFNNSNLHVLNYSTPIHTKLHLDELKKHLFSLEKYPDWIPYKTSYYDQNWGFCLSHNQLINLPEDEYEVSIDSSLESGSLTYGELLLKGETDDEVIFSTYVCHPSMCNDNLSGPTILTYLAKEISKRKTKLSYRFLFLPETIGAITWLSINKNNLNKIKAGLVATCLGDPGNFTYKKSKLGISYIDKITIKLLEDNSSDFKIEEFKPFGSDERQYCSPGINLPIGSLMKTMYYKFPEYHTSADNLEFVTPKSLESSFLMYYKIYETLEDNDYYENLNPMCEPQLGKRGLRNNIGGPKETNNFQESIDWILNMSDGKNSLLDIAIKSNLNFELIKKCADILEKNQLIKKI